MHANPRRNQAKSTISIESAKMTNFESLPLELVLPIVKEAIIRPWDSQYDKKQLFALLTISPPFKFSALTLLHEEISLAFEEPATNFLATRHERYVVESIAIQQNAYSAHLGQEVLTLETALKIIRVCKNLEGLTLRTREFYVGLINEPNLKSESQISSFISSQV